MIPHTLISPTRWYPTLIDYLEFHRLPMGVVRLPTGPVVGLTRDEVDPSHVGEEILVRIRGLVAVTRM